MPYLSAWSGLVARREIDLDSERVADVAAAAGGDLDGDFLARVRETERFFLDLRLRDSFRRLRRELERRLRFPPRDVERPRRRRPLSFRRERERDRDALCFRFLLSGERERIFFFILSYTL